jgi:hypothetical protein
LPVDLPPIAHQSDQNNVETAPSNPRSIGTSAIGDPLVIVQ